RKAAGKRKRKNPPPATHSKPERRKETASQTDVLYTTKGEQPFPRPHACTPAAGPRTPPPVATQTEHRYLHSGRWTTAGNTRCHAAACWHISCQTWSGGKLKITGTERSEAQALCPAHTGSCGISEKAAKGRMPTHNIPSRRST